MNLKLNGLKKIKSCFLLNVRKKNLLITYLLKNLLFNKIVMIMISLLTSFLSLSVSLLSVFYHSRYKLAITSFVFIEEMFSFFNTRFECTKETISRIGLVIRQFFAAIDHW